MKPIIALVANGNVRSEPEERFLFYPPERGLMLKNTLALLLSALMASLLGAQPITQQTSSAVQGQVGLLAKGSLIEVKMKPNNMRKVTGRLGEVTADGFEVQVAQEQKVDTVKLLFADVKSVAEKPQHARSHKALWVILGAGAATVIVLVAIGAVVASR